MAQFKKVGRIVKCYNALELQLEGINIPFYIGARDVSALFDTGIEVPLQKVVESKKNPNDLIILEVGKAWISKSGRAINFWVAGNNLLLTAPIQQVKGVLEGARAAVAISAPIEEAIIDADKVAHSSRRIDEGLINSF